MDYSKFQTVPAIPEASSMIETFRAIGYTIESAIADIIDNSISAGAKNVWASFEWSGNSTSLSIRDDGCGMDSEELIEAMRPGSKNPLSDRPIKDLGRFGLGLKTASFSQCRKLTVISKKAVHDFAYWTWDLDYVNQTGRWELLNYLPDSAYETTMDAMTCGTIVIWNDIDRLVKDFNTTDAKAMDKFMAVLENVKKHLAMVFHRFIENGRLRIWFQEREVAAWNPFLSSEAATQAFPIDPLMNGKVQVKGFVLPHKSKISEDAFKTAEGPKGWNEQQGFYIYRNERLLLGGDWLGMFRKEEHYKLARILIDLPNTLDLEWQIDIKKSVARPPLNLRDQLKAYANKVRAQAVEVYRHKGKSISRQPGQKFVPLWLDHRRGDKWFYKINRGHPLLEHIRTEANTRPDHAIETLLRFIEETIPTKSIYIRESEEGELQGKPFEGIDQEPMRKTMQQMMDNLKKQGKSEAQAKAIIINIEPFNHYAHLLEFI